MTGRFCARCGAKSAPWIPRVRVGEEMWCSMCATNHRTAAAGRHPDIDWKVGRFGAANTSLGRVMPQYRTAATREEQESRLARPEGWSTEGTGFKPVRFAIEGARAYASKLGMPDPHDHDYAHVSQNADTVRNVGRAYDKLPEFDHRAVPHFEAMRTEVGHQFHHLTHTMGVHVETTDHDPYANVHEMTKDVADNRRLRVLGTHVTGGHPFFSNHENDQFRAVHDFFGHAATGRDFSRHGEEAAFQAHSRMFSPDARPAMASETKGQNTSLILNGHFGPQRVALLPKQHWGSRTAAAPGEDAIRAQIGRQKVHTVTVNGHVGPQLCPEHLERAQERSDFASGLAAQVGIPGHSYPDIRVSPQHEGACHECARRQQHAEGRPWERAQGTGWGPEPVSERQPGPSSLMHRRWRPHVDEFAEFKPGLQSMNMIRVALAHELPKPGRSGHVPIRRIAHDSGDGETIFHCPFCGSGQVIARSDGTCECEFCSTAFTVQVQPQLPAFPQTIDGQPIDVPGMPNGGQNANVPPGAGDPNDPNADPDDSNPFADPPGDDSAADGGDDSDDDSGGDKPPWLKSSALTFVTEAGHRLASDAYMRHLALRHSYDQQRALDQIRSENGVAP